MRVRLMGKNDSLMIVNKSEYRLLAGYVSGNEKFQLDRSKPIKVPKRTQITIDDMKKHAQNIV